MQIDCVAFSAPTERLLAWHIRLALQVQLPSKVQRVEVDGVPVDDWVLLQNGFVVPPVPSEAARHGVRKPAMHVSSASAGGQFVVDRGAPELAVFHAWQAGATYQVRMEIETEDGQHTWLEASAEAPSAGAFPFTGWQHQRLLRLREPIGVARRREPVEVMLAAYGDECRDWSRELRMGLYDRASGITEPVPFQVIRHVQANHTAASRREMCTTAWVVAFIDLEPRGESVLVCAWGQAEASPADQTSFGADLQVERSEGKSVTVRNAHYATTLCPRSGQIASLQPILAPDSVFAYTPGNGDRSMLHYNPDLWIPGRVWTHTCDWNPSPYAIESEGPLVFRTRRWGHLPGLSGVSCCVEYTFYAWTPWIRTRTVLEVEAVLTTNAIRNEEIVLNADQVDHCAWKDTDGTVHDQLIAPDPALPAGVVAIIRNEAPWIAFYRGDTGAGIAGIRVAQQATTRGIAERAYWNTGTLVADYGWGFRYWSRSLIYGTGDFWPDRECVVEPGALYTDECAYMPIMVGRADGGRFAELDTAEVALRQPIERVWSGSGPY